MAVDFDLSFLMELEREKVLDVLYRDQRLQKAEEERIRKLKAQLQQLRWKGAKSVRKEYQERSCARCQKALGRVLNRGAVCNGCSHRVCHECQVYHYYLVWKCTVCSAHGETKLKTGDWFFEERGKKFPSAGKHETTGGKLLKTFQKMNKISVVPPTPPPFSEAVHDYNAGELNKTKGFHKSVENIFLSLTTQVKKMSRSQNDMLSGKIHLTTDYGGVAERRKERRSHSDTAINIASQLEKSVSLHELIHKAKQEELQLKRGESYSAEEAEGAEPRAFFGKVKQPSIISINSICTDLGNADSKNVTGEIEFAVAYNLKTSTLEVSVKACRNLTYGDEKKKKCNPYVKAYLLPDKSSTSKLKTSVKKNTLDPLFNESLKYVIERSQLETRTLQVSVWHSGTLKRKVFLGEVSLPLELWDFEDSFTQSFNWYQLKAKPQKPEDSTVQYHGELLVRMRLEIPPVPSTFQYSAYDTEGKHLGVIQLHLIIKSAKNLPSKPDGALHPFVKSCLVLPNKPEVKQRTPTLRRQTCPEWNHTIIYNIMNPDDLKRSRLDVTVWDQGLSEHFLGGISMSAGNGASSNVYHQPAQLLWQQLLTSSNEWMEDSLLLDPNKGSFYF
ncbi:synaptotagmin-like protein 3 [Hyperolius riggenbachi]|uniref:synaptotagmin-like protein 3 n=1 Tax=Hyperolius riggenbachi TaxID=752182 RepID=UPI0035A2CFC1